MINAVVQCVRTCAPLREAFSESSVQCSPVVRELRERSGLWDTVAPFGLLNEIYKSYPVTFFSRGLC